MEQYDTIATEYQASKQLPFRLYAEAPLLEKLLGDVAGKNILDLGCGEGIYARKLKTLGARLVVGVDVSSEMVALAQKIETAKPLGIRYEVADAANVEKLGEFDIVLGSYLLNYARNPEHLAQFCRAIAKNLKPGGRFVGINDNPANALSSYPKYKKYGFIKHAPTPRSEGDVVRYTLFQENGEEFGFDNFYLAPETYTRTFAATGFNNFKWHIPTVTPEGLNRLGRDYWHEFNDDPPVIGVEAIKNI